MDSQSYLNEISSVTRPAKSSKPDFLQNKFVLVGIIGVIGIILMAVVGMVLGGGRAGNKEQSIELKLRLDSTSKVISDYQKSVKSSDLRSSSASLDGVVTNTNRDLTAYITEVYNFETPDQNTQATEDERQEALEAELFEAKINGILDRIYAHKMAYEISIIMSMESKLYDSVSNEDLKGIIKTSYDSLKILQDKFSGFSEAK